MAIELTTPFVTPEIPAVPAKVYDSIWIKRIVIEAPSPKVKTTANIIVSPYDSISGSVSTTTRPIVIRDVFLSAQNTASIAAAVTAIYAAVQELVNSGNVFSGSL